MTGWWERTVYIREWTLRAPAHDRVFHRGAVRRSYQKDAPQPSWVGKVYSACGRVVDHWEDGRDQTLYTMLHEDVASKIARPCRRCYEVTD